MDTERLIVESSVILISIFSTIGLLIGTTSQQFKDVYIYFGYMLYFGFPFIFAALFGMISIVAVENQVQDVASALSTSFYLTGFLVLFYLACAAAQTAALPGSFVYLIPAQYLAVTEFLLSMVLLIAQSLGKSTRSSRRLARHIKWVQPLVLFLAIVVVFSGAILMSIYGVQKAELLRETRTMSLEGESLYRTQSANFTLDIADQISFKIISASNAYFHYVFLDKQNYDVYQNESNRLQAKPIREGTEKEVSFIETVGNKGTYFLAMESRYFLGANITYEVVVNHFDNSNMTFSLVVVSLGIFGILFASKSVLAGSIERPQYCV